MSHILIVEDEDVIRVELKRLLTRAGHVVSEAASVTQARAQWTTATNIDLVLTDLRLPDGQGTQLVSAAAPIPVVLMTSYATIPSAVEAMRLGAADYLAKPFDHDELMAVLERWLHAGVSTHSEIAGMVGDSQVMREVFTRLLKVAPTDATVLITGESGTGKELVARAIHEHSKRRGAALVNVNCAAVPDTLLESELFGHERGAFTGATNTHVGLVEAASGGTLFLDEIGELPANAQARLLRVLQDGEVRRVGATRTRRVDVRLIAATHRDLRTMVRAGSFREDLYHRLRVLDIVVPPLRMRGDDVARLAQHFLARRAGELGRRIMTLSQDAAAALRSHSWPGNVRELQNALERAAILCEDGVITQQLLAIEFNNDLQVSSAALSVVPSDGDSLQDYLRQFVLDHQSELSETELARRLGISRKSLWERRTRLGIPRPRPHG
jgi:DNA-binding NtrC family response regulator